MKKDSLRITDIIFFGSMFIMLIMLIIVIICISTKIEITFPLTEVWLGFLFIVVVFPKIFFRKSKYVKWLEKDRLGK